MNKINESRGTPSIIKEVFNEIKNDLDNILKSNISNSIFIDIDKSSLINNKQVSLKSNLKILLEFTNITQYNGNINFLTCIKSDFKDCIISLSIPKDPDKKRVYKSLLHELTHLYEIYQVKDIFYSTSWQKSISLSQFDRTEIKPYIEYFRDIFYISLPHEIRATISSVEIFLISLFTKDIDILRNELKKTTEWNRYESIRDFDPEQLSYNLINDYNSNNVIRMLNIFNKINNIDFILKKESDILRYFKGWKKYLNRVSEKMYSKIEKKIIEISNKKPYDGEVYETHEDKNILRYEDYREKNRRERNLSDILSININDFL
jgi:hypothetical protein